MFETTDASWDAVQSRWEFFVEPSARRTGVPASFDLRVVAPDGDVVWRSSAGGSAGGSRR